jgi:integrase
MEAGVSNNVGKSVPLIVVIYTVSAWAELYFQLEVTTSARSQQEQRRDLQRFLDFLFERLGSGERQRWTPRVSRAFVDHLRKERKGDQRRWSDRTINRMLAHLKTFSKWIHKHRAFPLGDPMAKLHSLPLGRVLELERALSEEERQRLLDAADYLPVIGGRSRDKRRFGQHLPDQRPQRKSYRPWRNRAIVYTLVETGMRRAEVITIDRADVDFKRKRVVITEKGGQRRGCQVSTQGMNAIKDYLENERPADAARWASPALFLPAMTVANSAGRLAPTNINTIWKGVCQLVGLKGRTPHSARHGMGVHIIKKTGNPRAVPHQLGHKNPSTTMQYMQFTGQELQDVLDNR